VKRLSHAIALVLPIAFSAALSAQGPATETATTVPALEKFHEVIMPMWHSAYPAKDYAELRKIAPEVEAGVATIAAAKLPAILHEKQSAWDKGIAELEAVAAAYAKAAAGRDDKALLLAAESLHATYEAQGQIIRPVLPEMNEFHRVLYVVQHTYVPEKKWAEVCKVSGELEAKAEALAKATLPKRAASKTDAFQKAAPQLVIDAKALTAACTANQAVAIEQATSTLHATYEGLSTIFE
jgi:hypothetical protein